MSDDTEDITDNMNSLKLRSESCDQISPAPASAGVDIRRSRDHLSAETRRFKDKTGSGGKRFNQVTQSSSENNIATQVSVLSN